MRICCFSLFSVVANWKTRSVGPWVSLTETLWAARNCLHGIFLKGKVADFGGSVINNLHQELQTPPLSFVYTEIFIDSRRWMCLGSCSLTARVSSQRTVILLLSETEFTCSNNHVFIVAKQCLNSSPTSLKHLVETAYFPALSHHEIWPTSCRTQSYKWSVNCKTACKRRC